MYASRQDLLRRFGPKLLADLAGRTPGVRLTAEMIETAIEGGDTSIYTQEEQKAIADALAVIDEALEDADAEIAPYLQVRYTLPLPSVPRLLVNVAADLAAWRLLRGRQDEGLRQRYEDAIAILRRINRGELELGLDSAQQPVESPPQKPQYLKRDRTFDLNGY